MKQLNKKIRIVKKHREPVKISCGSVVSTITFPKDLKLKGEITRHTDHTIIPKVMWGVECNSETPKELQWT